MSLSLNWKALSSRIQPEKANHKKAKKIIHKKKNEGKTIVLKSQAREVSSIPNPKLLTPLEFALWTCSANSGFRLRSGEAKRVVEYGDKKKSAPGKFLAIDCEFVGVGPDDHSELARVSIVNYYGVVLLDTYVKPEGRVTDWRTWVSGITPHHMRQAIKYNEARERVNKLVVNRVLIGHAVYHDLECLQISIPKHCVRDTARFPEFKKSNGGKMPSLKKLCSLHLGLDIQGGQHSSIEDAQAAMAIFRLHQKAFEAYYARH